MPAKKKSSFPIPKDYDTLWHGQCIVVVVPDSGIRIFQPYSGKCISNPSFKHVVSYSLQSEEVVQVQYHTKRNRLHIFNFSSTSSRELLVKVNSSIESLICRRMQQGDKLEQISARGPSAAVA